MNKGSFQDLVHGVYGRKVAYVNYDYVDETNILKIYAKATSIHNWNRAAIKYLWEYYRGDQPVLYREKKTRRDIVNRIVENHAYEIVQFKVGQTYGEPIQCISRTDDETLTKAIDKLNDYLRDAFKPGRDITCGEWQSAVGTGFKATQIVEGEEIPFRLIVPTPMNTYIAYSESTQEPLVAFQALKDENGESYTLCYTKSYECKIKNSKIVEDSYKLHGFGGIPIVEYPNNSERISDIELVIGILDALNNMQSNRMDAVEQFVQFCMVFTNCEVDEETIASLDQTGAIALKTNNKDNKASFDIIDKELNQTQSQVAKDDLWHNAQSILAIPSKEGGGSKSGDSQGAVELRGGWDFSKSRALLKDAFVKESEKRLYKCILHIIKVQNGENDCPVNVRDIEISIPHGQQDNMVVKAQCLQYLMQCGVHPLIALQTCGLWSDAEKVFMMSQPYIAKVWKKLEEDGIDIEEQKAKAELFTQLLNSGADPKEAAEKSGLQIDTSANGFKKWNYGEDE